LYLYSGPSMLMPNMTSHLCAFNKMFSYGAHDRLDLNVNGGSGRSCTPLANTVPPFNLSLQDTMHLAEINSGTDFCSPHPLGGAVVTATDPAECVQGPGC
jgi:hypothetical protein